MPDLAAGDWLLPRSVTGIVRPHMVLAELKAAGKGGSFARLAHDVADAVFVTVSLAGAREYARGFSMWLQAVGAPGLGAVYEVEPDFPMTSDAEDVDGWACSHARVMAVAEAAVPARCGPAEDRAVRELAACYREWRVAFNAGADCWPVSVA